MAEIRECARHQGDDCQWCSGTGFISTCNKAYCVEHGCDGSGGCFASELEIKKHTKKRELKEV